ncbi:hypothetical protein EVAR_28789_1 [Eumeta japonica]|uniref:Uncharacterized protein n=1 Tax=Eumeta variegata TaxID=151549 RepID=A0A4C1VGW2_EUMVA|nr:hypothetical protein EVAR_28789_1 [Eumeta japonica]
MSLSYKIKEQRKNKISIASAQIRDRPQLDNADNCGPRVVFGNVEAAGCSIVNDRVLKEMLKAAMEVCKSAFLPAIAAVFCTARSQQIAQELGFEKYNEIYYVRYLIDDEVVFADAGKGNHGAVLMALRIPGVVEPEPERKEAAPRGRGEPFQVFRGVQIKGIEYEKGKVPGFKRNSRKKLRGDDSTNCSRFLGRGKFTAFCATKRDRRQFVWTKRSSN